MVGVVLAFWRFSVGNRERIRTQNEEYLSELTVQRAISIDSMMDENLHFIENTAHLYAESLTSPEADISVIRRYEESTAFEMLRFIDKNGDNYTSSGVAANLSDRAYFQSGMQGETGITYVDRSRVTGQKQLGYYSPVYYDGQIIGIMVGFYGEEYIQRTLDFELFGINGEGWLCTSDGMVVGSTLDAEPDNYLEYLASSGRCNEKELAVVQRAFDEGEAISFTYTENEIDATSHIVPLQHDGWLLIRSFPPEASEGILKRANQEGTRLLLGLIVLFAVYISVLVIFFIVEKNRTREANRKGVVQFLG
ncbi:MAG: cache domain-containing protein [Clostridia bacterium]|nr:cache domain-containing protein [Clostridia bacterium]